MIRLWPFHLPAKPGRKQAAIAVAQKNDELRHELARIRLNLLRHTTKTKMDQKTDG